MFVFFSYTMVYFRSIRLNAIEKEIFQPIHDQTADVAATGPRTDGPHSDGISRFRWSPARKQHRSPREFQCIGGSNRYGLAAPRWEPDKCCCLVLRLSHGRKLITKPDHGGRSYVESIVRNPDRKKTQDGSVYQFFSLSLSPPLSLLIINKHDATMHCAAVNARSISWPGAAANGKV